MTNQALQTIAVDVQGDVQVGTQPTRKCQYKIGAPMPLKLKSILVNQGITQTSWRLNIKQSSGKAVSRTLANLMLNWGVFPNNTPKKSIMDQNDAYLRSIGIDEQSIISCWEVDGELLKSVKPHHSVGAVRMKYRTPQKIEHVINVPEAEMLSTIAKKHFKLFVDPFQDDVKRPEHVFMSTEQRYIRESMFQTAKSGGILAIVGESGAGKTTLRRDLIDRIHRENIPITIIQPRIIDKARLEAGTICDAIIRDISQDAPKRSLEAKARQIEDLLTGSSRAGNKHVLIIEEAHDLTVKTLKLLKRFWEIEDGFTKLLSIILVGQPELKRVLDERRNWDAREFIRRCEVAELLPLNGNLMEYIALKFGRCNVCPTTIFAPNVYDAIKERLTMTNRGSNSVTSMMYPLVVNNVLTKSMNLAADLGAKLVEADIIREV